MDMISKQPEQDNSRNTQKFINGIKNTTRKTDKYNPFSFVLLEKFLLEMTYHDMTNVFGSFLAARDSSLCHAVHLITVEVIHAL